jgi:hypothetical protein
MVLADSNRIPRAPLYSGATSYPLTISSTGLSPSLAGFPIPFDYHDQYNLLAVLQPPTNAGFGLLQFRSPLLSELTFVLFSFRYLDVSVP